MKVATRPLDSSQTKPEKDSRATGLRADIRRVLYLGFKYELGCPGESECPLFQRSQEAACVNCPKHLKPVEFDPSPAAIPRVKFIAWLEGLLNAGCKLDPNDLPLNAWEGLAALKAERNRFERILMDSRQDNREQERSMAKAQNDARKLDGIPPPGASIFKTG